MNIHSLVVCVEYDDLLAVTLPRNARQVSTVTVVTIDKDNRTKMVTAREPNAKLFVTDAFYRNGAKFNKGLAIEEALTEMRNRSLIANQLSPWITDWCLIWDADTLFAPRMSDRYPLSHPQDMRHDCLFTPRRVLMHDPQDYTLERVTDSQWQAMDVCQEREFPGYFQLFNPQCPELVALRAAGKPWYGTNWADAGGCDSDFQRIWPPARKVRPDFKVLHLGPHGSNWCGRHTPRVDNIVIPEHLAAPRREAQRELLSKPRRPTLETAQ